MSSDAEGGTPANHPGPGSRAGARFGPYTLTRLLGRGGLGEVYAAEDSRDDRAVALKLIGNRGAADGTFATRVKQQIEAAAQLTEPHLLPVEDYGHVDELTYLATRLIEGTDLATLLQRSGPLSPPRAVALVHQIAAALDAAHAAGLVHGDVKPENILVTGEDFAYLVDFGIARAATATDDDTDHTGAADVSALAGVLNQCLAGSRPGRIPAALDEVMARSLATTPGQRYPSAGALAAAACAALSQPERNQVARILRRGETPAAPAVRLPSSRPTLPSELLRPRWYTPALARLRQLRKPLLAGAVAVAVGAAGLGVGHLVTGSSHGSSVAAARQVVLPFTGLDFRLSPGGVAVSAAGDVYVTSQGVSGRLVKLPAGSTTPAVLPVGDLYQPQGVAVDGRGNVYFSDLNNRVVKSEAGTDAQTVLPFVGLAKPAGLAVDAAGNVYVADRGNNQVVKWDAAANAVTTLPFGALRNPSGVAVDDSGGVYVTDTDNNRVVKLAGETTVLPFTGIALPWGIAVGGDRAVYVTEYRGNKVAKLAAGSAIPAVLAFTGLNTPSGVAVDTSGTVYVADRGNDRVLKLPGR